MPRVWAFFADDDPHPRWPPGQIHEPGELGDPRPVTGDLLGVIGRGPHVGRDQGQRVDDGGGETEPEGVRRRPVAQVLHDLMGAAGTVGADEYFASYPPSGGKR